MAGNGDERQIGAWDRVEAKLDRVLERLGHLERASDVHTSILEQHAQILDRHSLILERLERRMSRIEAEMEGLRLTIQHVAQETDRKLERFKDELLSTLGREVRVELLAAQTLNDGRLAALERRVGALEAARP
jgi:FKBP-type peptidyl-prolyl cis-trans isomerase (trigger factor)